MLKLTCMSSSRHLWAISSFVAKASFNSSTVFFSWGKKIKQKSNIRQVDYKHWIASNKIFLHTYFTTHTDNYYLQLLLLKVVLKAYESWRVLSVSTLLRIIPGKTWNLHTCLSRSTYESFPPVTGVSLLISYINKQIWLKVRSTKNVMGTTMGRVPLTKQPQVSITTQ